MFRSENWRVAGCHSSKTFSHPSSYYAGVYHNELSCHKCVNGSSLTGEEDECLLRCTSDGISRQLG